jgi:hypothetical protein
VVGDGGRQKEGGEDGRKERGRKRRGGRKERRKEGKKEGRKEIIRKEKDREEEIVPNYNVTHLNNK